MTSKYLKIILRGFVRRPLYPLLNILCLIIGFFTAFNVSLWLQNELSYDDYHENSTYIYRISIEVNNPEIGYHTHFARSWLQWLSEIYPGFPFEYTFIEDLYENVYKNEVKLKNLGKLLGIIALVLSCLGLWALTGIIYQQRTKEIGVRRVNGARIYQIVWLLIKEVLIMMMISLLMGFPVAWYLIKNWLNNFPYRIELNWTPFLLIGLFLIITTLTTAGYHAVKTSLQDPVNSLRQE